MPDLLRPGNHGYVGVARFLKAIKKVLIEKVMFRCYHTSFLFVALSGRYEVQFSE